MQISKRALVLCLVGLLLIMLTACNNPTGKPKQESLTKPDESFLQYGETNETIVELTKINSSVWVHTSYYEENGVLIPNNGLIVLTDKSIVLIDTPWTEQQMVSLRNLVQEAFNGTFHVAIITHAHRDSMGGVSYLLNNKVPVSSLEMVAKAAQAKGLPVPDRVYEGEAYIIEVDDTEFEIFYPGRGATSDNTVVWISKHNVLYGGCLVRAYGANSLGDTKEAYVSQWPVSLEAIKEKYTDLDVIVPSQGQWGDASLIDYTLELLEE